MYIYTSAHIHLYITCYLQKEASASQMVLVVKNSLDNTEAKEMQARSLGQEDPLEEGIMIYSSILAWKIPWTEKPCEPQFIGSQRVRHD